MLRTRHGLQRRTRTSVIARGLALIALLLLSAPSDAAAQISERIKGTIADLMEETNTLLFHYEGVLHARGLWERPGMRPALWNELLALDGALAELNELTGAVEMPDDASYSDEPTQLAELARDLDDPAESLFQSGKAINQLMGKAEITEEVYQDWSRIYPSLREFALAYRWRDTHGWDTALDREFDWSQRGLPQPALASDEAQ